MTEYPYESLKNAPITQGSTYCYGKLGGMRSDPLVPLLNAKSGGGIRPAGKKNNRAYVIVTSNDNPNWKDKYDVNSRNIFLYHGDCKEGNNPDKGRGNAVLREVYEERRKGMHCTPILIFKRTPQKNAFEFLGVSRPYLKDDGSPGYEEYVKNGVSNYLFKLDVVNTGDCDLRRWIEGLKNDRTCTDGQPPNWNANISKPENDDESFFTFLRKKKFDFDNQTVIDFLLGLKVKPFMILCGGTGTGKTKLAQLYGKYLEQKFDGRTQIVPVGSNWTENRHVVGYTNAITGKYVRTRSLDLIDSASKNGDKPHMLILDEMNLSHIERYFSDILSVMETGDPLMKIGNEDVNLTDNLFIIGTINMDETTHPISPKVLDRANVISFTSASVGDYLSGELRTGTPRGNVQFLQDCMNGSDIRKKKAPEIYEELQKADEEAASGINDRLSKIQEAMNLMDLPIGYRTMDEVMRFMYAAWKFEGGGQFEKWATYLDSQVLMKILPKIHGDSKISKGLDELKGYCRDLGRSEKAVEKMIEVLRYRRYTSFIC